MNDRAADRDRTRDYVRTVFSGRSLLVDELVQLFQACIFTSDHLWLPVSAHREFFSALNAIDTGDKALRELNAGDVRGVTGETPLESLLSPLLFERGS